MCWWRCEPREKRLSKICGIFEMVPSPNLCIDIFFLHLSAQHTPLSTGGEALTPAPKSTQLQLASPKFANHAQLLARSLTCCHFFQR